MELGVHRSGADCLLTKLQIARSRQKGSVMILRHEWKIKPQGRLGKNPSLMPDFV